MRTLNGDKRDELLLRRAVARLGGQMPFAEVPAGPFRGRRLVLAGLGDGEIGRIREIDIDPAGRAFPRHAVALDGHRPFCVEHPLKPAWFGRAQHIVDEKPVGFEEDDAAFPEIKVLV